jgi:hypothetical protein
VVETPSPDGDPPRENLLNAINARSVGSRCVVLSYGMDKDQGSGQVSGQVFFTIMQADGSFKPVLRPIKVAGQ